MIELVHVDIALRVPLDTDGRVLQLRLPCLARRMHFGVEMREASVLQCPVEAFAGYLDGQNVLLIRLCCPTGPVHHPEEGRLDPSHPIHFEWGGAKGLMLYCRLGDYFVVGLIDRYGLVVIDCPDLSCLVVHSCFFSINCGGQRVVPQETIKKSLNLYRHQSPLSVGGDGPRLHSRRPSALEGWGAWAHSGGDCGVAAGEAGAAAGLSEGLAWEPAPHMPGSQPLIRLGASPSPRPGGGAAPSAETILAGEPFMARKALFLASNNLIRQNCRLG
jgi:hypothetical protein